MKSKKTGSEILDEAFDMRVNKGILPTIEIHGHTFYVDIRMDKLRPKDDFLSKGIVFSEIKDYLNDEKELYITPYDPKKKELGKIDYETITEIPKDLIVLKIPNVHKLDPVGWKRQHGYDLKNGIEKSGLQMGFKSKYGKWEDIYITQQITENIDKLKKSEKNKPILKSKI
ncbi:hypothetical protein SAMN05421741_1135 [Paenimyroides ummariense]|uniref:Uncharacterized protein n=1 Tax=Paenimyroides ummariense TaxID=913024 RepID=A0A1I5CNZ5_9FLAO|nr:hypothetical protein [Paenimyroides ummariense]SFN88688.1 hypothetical protein SAMN05421741_1135 [Paenimyroides ummariense]